MIGLVIVVVMVFIAVFAPVLAPYDPESSHHLLPFLKPFSEGHIFGTSSVLDVICCLVIYGARVSLDCCSRRYISRWCDRCFTWSDRRFHGRYCRLCDHANHGMVFFLPICTVIHYSDDSARTGTDQCYYRHRYRAIFQVLPVWFVVKSILLKMEHTAMPVV